MNKAAEAQPVSGEMNADEIITIKNITKRYGRRNIFRYRKIS